MLELREKSAQRESAPDVRIEFRPTGAGGAALAVINASHYALDQCLVTLTSTPDAAPPPSTTLDYFSASTATVPTT